MFDMGFTEMMLIGIVALIVIGPERLPGVARTAGKYFGRLKRFMTSVRADVEQELRADELRQILADQQRELDTLKDSINSTGQDLEKEVSEVGASMTPEFDAGTTPVSREPAAEDAAVEHSDSDNTAADTVTPRETVAEQPATTASPEQTAVEQQPAATAPSEQAEAEEQPDSRKAGS